LPEKLEPKILCNILF